MKVRAWSVARFPTWRPSKVEPPRDVTVLTVEAEWEHGQRQTVRMPFETSDVPQLAAELDAAAQGGSGVDARQVGHRADLAGSSPAAGVTAPVAGAGNRAGGGGSPDALQGAADRPGPPDRHDAMLTELNVRLERSFVGRPRARNAFLEPALRRHEVGSVEELPVAALAALATQLQRAHSST